MTIQVLTVEQLKKLSGSTINSTTGANGKTFDHSLWKSFCKQNKIKFTEKINRNAIRDFCNSGEGLTNEFYSVLIHSGFFKSERNKSVIAEKYSDLLTSKPELFK
jgi:hypothetical protein